MISQWLLRSANRVDLCTSERCLALQVIPQESVNFCDNYVLRQSQISLGHETFMVFPSFSVLHRKKTEINFISFNMYWLECVVRLHRL